MNPKRKSALYSLNKIHYYFKCPSYVNKIPNEEFTITTDNVSHNEPNLSSDDIKDASLFEVDENEVACDDSDLNDTYCQENISKATLKNCFKAIETASLLLRARNKKITSGLSLLQSHFKTNWHYFNQILHSAYWADKILIDSDNKLDVFQFLLEAFFPTKEFMIDISKTNIKNKILSSLVSISVVPTSNNGEIKHDSLPPMSSILVHNPVADQHGVFINAGSFVKRMSWAPLNPELHCDQYLAITVYKELSERGNLCDITDRKDQMLQIYNCGQLKLSTRQAEPSRLEMVLTHDWGRVTDICWSPQPLPAVSRSQKLIGHLAICCTDGFIRIIPISRLSRPGCLVTLDRNHPVLCLGTSRNRPSQPVYPTAMHWRPQFPDRIVAGYNTGHVALFVLESSVVASRATIHGTNVQLKPSVFRRAFRGACRSIKISPYNWRLVACSSLVEEHTVVIDLDQLAERSLPSEIDIEPTVGSRILWPAPGDIMVLASRKHLYNNPGVLLCPVQNPAGRAQKFSMPDISTIELCDSLNMVPIGTRQGQLRMLSLNTNHINELLRHLSRDSKDLKDLAVNNQLYHQYVVKPICTEECTIPTTAMKTEYQSESVLPCPCPPALKCVHKLIDKYSIMVDKNAHTTTHDWTLESMVCINEIATNPNPASSTWIAVALECGLVHLVPLTHFYRSNIDLISTGSCCDALDRAGRSLLNEMMLPPTLSYFSKHGRRRKYPPGVNYAQIYREMGKKYPLKSRPMKRDITEQDDAASTTTAAMATISMPARRAATKTTRITDYFRNQAAESIDDIPNCVPQSTPKKINKSNRVSKKSSSKQIVAIATSRKKLNSIIKREKIPKLGSKKGIANDPIHTVTRQRLRSGSSEVQDPETRVTSPRRNVRRSNTSSVSPRRRSRSLSGTKELMTGKKCSDRLRSGTSTSTAVSKERVNKITKVKKPMNEPIASDKSCDSSKHNFHSNQISLGISASNRSIRVDSDQSVDSIPRRLRSWKSRENTENAIDPTEDSSPSPSQQKRLSLRSRRFSEERVDIDIDPIVIVEQKSIDESRQPSKRAPVKIDECNKPELDGSIRRRLRSSGSESMRDNIEEMTRQLICDQGSKVDLSNIDHNTQGSENQMDVVSIRSRLRSYGASEHPIDESSSIMSAPRVPSGKESIRLRLRSRDSYRNGQTSSSNIDIGPDVSREEHVSHKEPSPRPTVALEPKLVLDWPRKLRSCHSRDNQSTDDLTCPTFPESAATDKSISKQQFVAPINTLCSPELVVVLETGLNTSNRTDVEKKERSMSKGKKNKVSKENVNKIEDKSIKIETSMFETFLSGDRTSSPTRKRLVSCESHEDSWQQQLSRGTRPGGQSLCNESAKRVDRDDQRLVQCSVTLTRGAFTADETYRCSERMVIESSSGHSLIVVQSPVRSTRKRVRTTSSRVETWQHFNSSLERAEIRKKWFPEKRAPSRTGSRCRRPKRQKLSASSGPTKKHVTNSNVALIRKLFPGDGDENVSNGRSQRNDYSFDEGSNSPSFSCDDYVIDLQELSDNQSGADQEQPMNPPQHAAIVTGSVPIDPVIKAVSVNIGTTNRSSPFSTRGHITDIDGDCSDSEPEPVVKATTLDTSRTSTAVNISGSMPPPGFQSTPKSAGAVQSEASRMTSVPIMKSEKREKSNKNISRISKKKEKKIRDVSAVKCRKKEKIEAQEDKSVKVKPIKMTKSEKIDSERLERLHNIFAMKRQELFDSQSVVSRTSWVAAQNPGPVDDPDVDLNKIDDISLGGSPRKKLHSSATVGDRMDKIKQVINRGLSQSAVEGPVVMNGSPELLQPFRPVKPSRVSSVSMPPPS